MPKSIFFSTLRGSNGLFVHGDNSFVSPWTKGKVFFKWTYLSYKEYATWLQANDETSFFIGILILLELQLLFL